MADVSVYNDNMLEKQLPYEKGVYQFLSLYRFFAYALAVGLMTTLPLSRGESIPLRLYFILGLVGVYTLVRMFIPPRLHHRELWNYLVLGSDLVVCVTVVLLTGGLGSGLLLYSLAPIMRAALLSEQKVSLALAAFSTLPLILAHSVFSGSATGFVWILQESWLSLFLTYLGVCFLMATIPFRSNLNIYRRIEADALLEERKRIAGEVHDGIAQSLGYLNLEAQLVKDSLSCGDMEKAVSKVGEMRKVMEETYQEVREAIDSLRLDTARDFALLPALREYLQQFSQRTRIHTELIIPVTEHKFSPLLELQLLRIAQEALSNVRKHSQADKVWVSLKSSPDGVDIVIKDNGKGFSPSEYAGEREAESHHGLSIMRERAKSLGGTVTVTSTSGEGTEVIARFPLGRARHRS